MIESWPPVRIVSSKDVVEQPVPPGDIIQAPYNTGLAILCDTGIPIVTKDVEEGKRRGLPDTEAVFFRAKTIGPGGGEAWHVHMSYYDIFFYILDGKGTMWWEQDGEQHQADFGPGDFVHMSPKSRHRWSNTGGEDLKLVEFGHFHNYENQ